MLHGALGSILFFPTTFLLVALFSFLLREPTYWLIYSMSLVGGCVIGLFATNRVPIKIDVACQKIFAPGSWQLLGCLLVLCIAKCGTDFFVVSMPAYAFQFKSISWLVKGAVTGMLYGQAISFFYRFLIAASCDTSELIRGRFAFFVGLEKVSRAHYAGIRKSSE
jgi:hypothetical protein